jgi:hypothetical protein
MAHKEGWVYMARKYWPVRLWLLQMGRWDILFKLKMYARTTGLTIKDAEKCEEIWGRLEKLHIGVSGEQWSEHRLKALNQLGVING